MTTMCLEEAIATAVSPGNTCPYCVKVHGLTLSSLIPRRDAGAITENWLD